MERIKHYKTLSRGYLPLQYTCDVEYFCLMFEAGIVSVVFILFIIYTFTIISALLQGHYCANLFFFFFKNIFCHSLKYGHNP